ncbi:MAG TPA: glutaminyl-peptide cyclotransferase [Acetobacteraceae bacterium]|nr:glutaminyl-peptide cyclotransferase [Acetobacteraceae bacterium]
MTGKMLGAIGAALLSLATLAPAAHAQRPTLDVVERAQLDRKRALDQSTIPVYGFKLMQTYPHDISAFTEGLTVRDGIVYEGTGLYGESRLRQYDLATGQVMHEVRLDKSYFGEGVTLLNDTIYQLTYISNTGFTYDRVSFKQTGTFRFPTQGWGLTTDGKHLLMSDGSSAIMFLDPKTLNIDHSIFVSDDVGPVGFLNELEYVDGKLYANIWETNVIAIIAPDTGRIIGWIDLAGLNPDPKVLQDPFVNNGIAYNAATGRLLVTGKCWPGIYEIDLVPRPR